MNGRSFRVLALCSGVTAARYCCLQFLILFIISFLRSASALALKCTSAQRRRDVLPDMSDPPSDSRMFNQMLNVAIR